MQHSFLHTGLLILCLLYQPVIANNSEWGSDIPFMLVSNAVNPAPGYIFTALKTGNYSHMFAFDAEGTPVFYRKFRHFIENVQPWPDGVISYYDFRARAYILLDHRQEIMDTIQMKNGYRADFHDFLRLPSGHSILMSMDLKTVDMSLVAEGGMSDATLSGLVIQELDSAGELVFEWNGWDHIEYTDSYVDLSRQSIDYIHPNSMWADSDSTLMISCRNTSEIIRISRRSGEIIWRMGGKNNDFTRLGDAKGFTGQHSISILNNGNLLLFDNSIDLENDPWLSKPPVPGKSSLTDPADQYSRGVEYELSVSAKTIRLYQEFPHTPEYKAANMGNIQRLDNGHTLISWGSATLQPGMAISEYDAGGELAFETGIENNTAQFYKVYKHPFHTGLFTLSKDSLVFGEVIIGESDSLELKITNPGTKIVKITDILQDHPYFSLDIPFPILIGPGTVHTLLIGFHPLEAGMQEEILTICSDTDTSRISRQVFLSGHGRNHVSINEPCTGRLILYPNPSEGRVMVTGLLSADRIRVYSLCGQMVYEDLAGNQQVLIDLSHLAKGSYIIRVTNTSGNTKTEYLILQ